MDAKENKDKKDSGEEKKTDNFASTSPSISLPKGGGSIHGMGEKFGTNPVTGTGTMSIPIATSPGRSGFGPKLSLSYNSGAGNGPFGFGWHLSLPSITRKTDKGLPQYRDAEESDVFILSDAEDLVPVFEKDQQNNWVSDSSGNPVFQEQEIDGYKVRLYQPRVEGLFARIERWSRLLDGDVHWRTLSRNNILTLYGKDQNSRIADPNDQTRIFSWLICETRDDKGNAVIYEYKPEDGVNVDLTQVQERNRGDENSALRQANRYLKRIYYGNTVSLLNNGQRPHFLTTDDLAKANWMFEVVLDYGEHNLAAPQPDDNGNWFCRNDPFSSYRSCFEVRSYRLCQRILMFHNFPNEQNVGANCLVRSTDFVYRNTRNNAADQQLGNPIASFIASATQNSYRRSSSVYLKKSLPPVEFEYSDAIINEDVENINPEALENLPIGIDGITYQWRDLYGEGVSGIFTEQTDGWFYKRNLSPIVDPKTQSENRVQFEPMQCVNQKPNASINSNGIQFMDLAGDGKPDAVMFDDPMPGFFKLNENEKWVAFYPFKSKPNCSIKDPNLKFIDLNGDGFADILITEDQFFTWFPSLSEEGFDAALHVSRAMDEEKGPAIVFADPTQSIYLADMSGDGLTDIVRVRNGEICYWPNVGYGRFGAKITMDNSPWFDNPDNFDQRRIRLADIDGSGTTDILYLASDGVQIYFNQAGNSWSDVQKLTNFPAITDLASITTVDLFGNGTACLVWSTPLPSNIGQQMRYVDLMGRQKPHLLIKTINNLGTETSIDYASSGKFYVQDRLDGKPWITRLPFPVHVVERIETVDRISHNRFVTRYSYHHGYFDGVEREFRGFGRVEQWDTEEFEILNDPTKPVSTNIDVVSYVPPIHTKTWFHTGVYLGHDRISNYYAGLLNDKDVGEYYPDFRSGDAAADAAAKALLLEDTNLPTNILSADNSRQPYQFSANEEREACRALKGSMLRQEIYALDGTDKEKYPYLVTEQNFVIECLQPLKTNRHSVFIAHQHESISYHYERNPDDPRVTHNLVLEVDYYNNVLQSASVAYGRTQPDLSITDPKNQTEQTLLYITCSESHFTNIINDQDSWRTPLPSETKSFELTGLALLPNSIRFTFDQVSQAIANASEEPYDVMQQVSGQYQKRVIEHVQTLYRHNDLSGPLPLHQIESLALPYESYKLAYTPGLINNVFSGKATDTILQNDGHYVHGQGDVNWWIPSGQVFYSPNSTDTAAQELAYAQTHFFLPHRYRNPFYSATLSTETFVTYDPYDLLLQETRDPFGNQVTAGVRNSDPTLSLVLQGLDYRVLNPFLVMDPNRNQVQVVFDTMGFVTGTAVMGKPEDNPQQGDILDSTFNPDLDDTVVLAHLQDPLTNPNEILQNATTRLLYDFFAYYRTKDQIQPQPAVVYTLARETHVSDLNAAANQQTLYQHQFSYSDGFGREIQKKIQAEIGPIPQRDPTTGNIIIVNNQPVMIANADKPRWVGSGWTIFNNKGKPVRQYEPFFTDLHTFEFEAIIGVSPILFYDPLDRVILTLLPNNTYTKIVFDSWHQQTWDVNDTVLLDPRTDVDIKGFSAKYFQLQPANWQTWLEQRITNPQTPPIDTQGQNPEQDAAVRTLTHASTPTTVYFDSLGRSFLTLADNGKDANGVEQIYATRIVFDIEGNQRQVIDAKGRTVMSYDYDILGNRIHQTSMEAGEQWMLGDVAGKPIRIWDNRGHQFRFEYDQLRRPVNQFVLGTDSTRSDPRTLSHELLIDKIVYGENQSNTLSANLLTRIFSQSDGAGIVTHTAYDFKGNLLSSNRQIAQDYKAVLDWSGAVPLAIDIYFFSMTYDALNRPLLSTSPDNSVIQINYNEANFLESLNVNLRGVKDSNQQPVWTPFITNIDYDAKGQRTLIQYGNGAETNYSYDPMTFRLIQLYTRRGAAFTQDCMNNPTTTAPSTPPTGATCGLQNLFYTYDPIGNITNLKDTAQQTIFFKNQQIDASNDYSYDAIYQLQKASGREHLGQTGNTAPIPYSYNDAQQIGLPHPGDGNAMNRYTETYQYDEVGNFMKMVHQSMAAGNPTWSRLYEYLEPSLLEASSFNSNRLTRTTINPNGAQPTVENYTYDIHGNMTNMPQLSVVNWDFHDRLYITQRQIVNAQDTDGTQKQGERTYYVYDSSGQRIRKVTETALSTPTAPIIKEERIYLGGFEIYKNYGSNALTRETLHIMDDKQRIAMVETRTQGVEEGVPA